MKVCNIRNDPLAVSVQHRVESAISDLHASDARYHQDCKRNFFRTIYLDCLRTTTKTNDDQALQDVIRMMNQNEDASWNSIEIENIYHEFGGFKLTRSSLVKSLSVYFGEKLLVLSSPGLASILVFKAKCHFSILTEDNDSDKNVKEVAASIRCEVEKQDHSKYRLRLDEEACMDGLSSTLMNLLAEIHIPKLPSILIGSIISSIVTKQWTNLQIAMSNMVRKKHLIEELHHYGITSTYDEYRLFRVSVACAVQKRQAKFSLHNSKKLIQAVGDNFDAKLSTPNGLKQTHSMALILTQESTPEDIVNSSNTVKRLSKNEMQKFQPVDLDIVRYKGPAKPEMPVHAAKYNIASLAILCRQVLSFARANEADFSFLSNAIEDNECPEYNGFNTAIARKTGCKAKPQTSVKYIPLINMNPADPDTILTSMHKVAAMTEEAGQIYTLFTNDQQLYRITLEMTWWQPEEWQHFVPILGGMHTLMSFVGCVGTLMANSGLTPILKSAFGGVEKMLSGKKFPQNIRALRLVVEELLRETLRSNEIVDLDELISILDERASVSRTARLWLDALVKPVLIMMKFVRAAREADWVLHIAALKMMLPYFGAAGHWNYLRYGLAYLIKMSQLPPDLVKQLLQEEHAMCHRSSLWNSIWSDMMIETTVMRYGHGPSGMIGITLNEKALEVWALSLHATTQLEKDLLDLKEENSKTPICKHKEEEKGRIASDNTDRKNIEDVREKCMHPFSPTVHKDDIVNIYTGKISNDKVNVDKCVSIGAAQVKDFYDSLPVSFYKSLSKKVITMNSMSRNVKVGSIEVVDTNLIYSRVIALQLAERVISPADIFKHELAPVPTSMFDDFGDMRIDKSKSKLKMSLAVELPSRRTGRADLVVLDGCAILWIVHWPSKAKVSDFVSNFQSYVSQLLKASDVSLIFDRYYEYSIKSATRSERAKSAGLTYVLSPESPLPARKTILQSVKNKVQLIALICNSFKEAKWSTNFNYTLTVTGEEPVPFRIQNGVASDVPEMVTSHEEADVIIVQQAYKAVIEGKLQVVHIICDDTDVFALLVYFYWKMQLDAEVLMLPTDTNRKVTDIKKSVEANLNIVPSLLAAHALSGCDTTGHFQGIGKGTVSKKLKEGLQLEYLGNLQSDLSLVQKECTVFMSSCYGILSESMTQCRLSFWLARIAKAKKKAPELKTLPPTDEAFLENVKRAHLQCAIWYSSLEPDPLLMIHPCMGGNGMKEKRHFYLLVFQPVFNWLQMQY